MDDSDVGEYTLRIGNITQLDKGIYTCIDDAGFGPDQASATLFVIQPGAVAVQAVVNNYEFVQHIPYLVVAISIMCLFLVFVFIIITLCHATKTTMRETAANNSNTNNLNKTNSPLHKFKLFLKIHHYFVIHMTLHDLFISHLNSIGFLDSKEQKDIKQLQVTREKVECLFEILEKKPDEALEQFLNVLEISDQNRIVSKTLNEDGEDLDCVLCHIPSKSADS